MLTTHDTSFGMMALIAFGVPLLFSTIVLAIAIGMHQLVIRRAKHNVDSWEPEPMHPYDDLTPPKQDIYALYMNRHMNIN